MGTCVAGGAYLPVLCDTVLMTEGSGLYLAGPALVKAAIGQDITSDELGGAAIYFASEASSFCNGQVLTIDGGMIAAL